jgi:hypothetical protein
MHAVPHKNPRVEFQQRFFQIEEATVSFEIPALENWFHAVVNGRALKWREEP